MDTRIFDWAKVRVAISEARLNQWTNQAFVDSLERFFEERKYLTEKQYEALCLASEDEPDNWALSNGYF